MQDGRNCEVTPLSVKRQVNVQKEVLLDTGKMLLEGIHVLRVVIVVKVPKRIVALELLT